MHADNTKGASLKLGDIQVDDQIRSASSTDLSCEFLATMIAAARFPFSGMEMFFSPAYQS